MYQASLLALDEPLVDDQFVGLVHRDLGCGAWLDQVSGWVQGSDSLFDEVREQAPWAEHTRKMFDQVVAEPRLSTRRWSARPAAITAMANALSDRYQINLRSVSANLYRDGRDSVAWHGDTAGRQVSTTIVAIVSLGSPRRFLLRPRGGGISIRLTPSHGDLLVLGGTAQHSFEHAVPKMATAGPRVSVMFREPGVF